MDISIIFKRKSSEDNILLKPFLVSNEAFKESLNSLLSPTYSLKDQYSALMSLSSIIKGQKISFEKNQAHFVVPTSWQVKFSEYMDNWHFLPLSRIFFEWSDVAEEGIKLLSTLITENNLENFEKDVRYEKFLARFHNRLTELCQRKEYQYLNDSGW